MNNEPMKTEREIRDRIDGNVLELDAFLDPRAQSTLKAADRQGWITALRWVLGEEDEAYDKRQRIKEQYEKEVDQ